MPITWTGVLFAVDTPTGDNRMISAGALEIPPTPFPLRFVDQDYGAHKGAFPVGTVEEVWSDGNLVRARGTFDAGSPRGLEAARLAATKIKPGISIRPDKVVESVRVFAQDGTEIPLDQIPGPDHLPDGAKVFRTVIAGRVRSADIVDVPAFIEARIEDVQIDGFDVPEPIPGLTAAAASHSGAMVALVPDEASAARMTVDDHEPTDVLHLTLFFLGPAADIDDATRDEIAAALVAAVDDPAIQDLGTIDGNAWAVASFNPTQEQAATYLVGGPELETLRDEVGMVVGKAFPLPEQHQPWIPHVTVGYDLDPATITEPAIGPITFDRLRLAFGPDDVRDYPLRARDDMAAELESAESPEPDPESVTAAAVPPHSTDSVAGDWDGTAVEKALPSGEDPAFYADYYAYLNDAKGDGTAKDHWHYLHHYREGDTGRAGAASVTACRAIIGLLNGARGTGTKATGGDRQTVYDHVARHLADAGYDVPPLQTSVQYADEEPTTMDDTTTDAAPASMFALQSDDPDCDIVALSSSPDNVIASGHGAPSETSFTIPALPADHFTPFDLVEQTPLTVTESGQVFGHVALDRICHVGMPKCVTMPRSASGLRYFHTGVVRLSDGTDIATGRITMRGPHADVRLNWQAANAHYDDVTTTVADVVAVEDDHGIAVFGHLRPGTTPEMVHAFRASTPSGDWRRLGSGPELINVHMVNSPGFPIYRAEHGRLEATIAASALPARYLGGDIPAAVIASAHGFPETTSADLDQETRIARKVIELLRVDAEFEAENDSLLAAAIEHEFSALAHP